MAAYRKALAALVAYVAHPASLHLLGLAVLFQAPAPGPAIALAFALVLVTRAFSRREVAA